MNKGTQKNTNRLVYFFKEYNIVCMLIALMIISSILSPKFLTTVNLLNLCNQMAAPIVIATGMLLVILIGGIDLSVGSLAAVGSVITAKLCFQMDVRLAILVTLILGCLLGVGTGLLVAYAKMAPFIATLAMQTIGTGIAFIVSRGAPVPPPNSEFAKLGAISVGPFNGVVILALIVLLAFAAIQRFTSYGRILMAIGSNENVVKLAGIRLNLHKVSVYAISSFCATLGGIIISIRTTIGSPQIGVGMELDAIAAAVIGGASLNGGRGTVLRTLVGVICLTLIRNVMNLLGIPSYPQDIVKGVIIILAVILQGFTTDNT